MEVTPYTLFDLVIRTSTAFYRFHHPPDTIWKTPSTIDNQIRTLTIPRPRVAIMGKASSGHMHGVLLKAMGKQVAAVLEDPTGPGPHRCPDFRSTPPSPVAPLPCSS